MFLSNSCTSTMDSGDSSDFQLLSLNTDEYCEKAKWKVCETGVAAVVHRWQKAKVVEIPRTSRTHNSRGTSNISTTQAQEHWMNIKIPPQVARPQHLVSLTSICYFLRKSYAEHSCKEVTSSMACCIFMDSLQNDFGWFHGANYFPFWVGSQITFTHDSFEGL